MNKASKIFIAGRNGLVGSAIERRLRQSGYENIIGLRSKVLDLRIQKQVEMYFEEERPDYVILAAAKVGGIWANMNMPADFLYENLEIQNHVIQSSWKYGVKKLVFLASSCIYPRLCPQPMKEEYLLDGKLEPTNEGYALAKITGLKLCEYMNQQYGMNCISLMPCNLFGVKDNFHPMNSHMVPALIRRMHHAKVSGSPSMTVWGTGKVRRELMCSDDLADACLFLLESNYSGNQFLNIGTGVDFTIQEIAEQIQKIVGYEGTLVFDPSKPDGMPRKVLDVSKIHALGWQASIPLEEGMARTYAYYTQEVFPKETRPSGEESW